MNCTDVRYSIIGKELLFVCKYVIIYDTIFCKVEEFGKTGAVYLYSNIKTSRIQEMGAAACGSEIKILHSVKSMYVGLRNIPLCIVFEHGNSFSGGLTLYSTFVLLIPLL